jgi:hypothetical protein
VDRVNDGSPVRAAFYLHKVDECARLAGDARDPRDQSRFISERRHWLQFLADEIGTDVGLLEAVIASLPRGEMYMMVRMSASSGNAARLLRLIQCLAPAGS